MRLSTQEKQGILNAKARAMQERIKRTRWICGASIATIVTTVAAAVYFRSDIIALNHAGGWPGFIVTFGGCCLLAIALTVLFAIILPDDLKQALGRGWL
ncbi:hypothetical protein [Acidithiobacillus marinus]|nr:hypothetical protein [Acidithiobacillus marinus]